MLRTGSSEGRLTRLDFFKRRQEVGNTPAIAFQRCTIVGIRPLVEGGNLLGAHRSERHFWRVPLEGLELQNRPLIRPFFRQDPRNINDLGSL
jgi:hypothetical protein